MPFTAAHPAAVLPLLALVGRLRLDVTCLVIGSMAPDFEYFGRAKLLGTFAHSWPGVILFGVPATLLVAALYHHWLKWLVLLVSPTCIARCITGVVARPWRSYWTASAACSLVVSAALGNLTHLAWDSITHQSGGPVQTFSVLMTPVLAPVSQVHLYRLLQHGSTLLGFAILGLVLRRQLERRLTLRVPPSSKRRARALALTFVVAGGAILNARLHTQGNLLIGHAVVATVSGVLAGLLVASGLCASSIGELKRGMRG